MNLEISKRKDINDLYDKHSNPSEAISSATENNTNLKSHVKTVQMKKPEKQIKPRNQ